MIQKNTIARLTAILALGLGAFGAFAQSNILANGSFEIGPAGVQKFTDWDWVGPADNNSDYGVSKSASGADAAEQGSYYAYFHGHPNDGSQDCLGVSVYLEVGAKYAVSYYLGTDGTTLGSGASMKVVIGSSFGIDLSQDIALPSFFPNSSNALSYQLFTTNITATQSSPILSFHGVDSTSSILLDNVSMTLLAPPPTLLNFSVSANGLTFTWPAAASGYRLQSSSSLGSTNWVTLTNEPGTAGTNNQIVLPPPGSNIFYRLTWEN